ncbi:uncharacterized protein N7477_003001 [Penicillium maclennaniae]|uniref:uncharacterized protein n=1 Tax=Penicillium maclennaniae TaxID=1343394 RepID=UPI0025409D82|nr:uncharacterized protein N7477_003001 [Penicillium maclennaniae]KAJ5677368.1 hypothetical protein N7477_003001 [Penicillium maclennaniae]
MSSQVAFALVRPSIEAGARPSASMAALMHSNNEPVAVSNPIVSNSIASSEPLSFLKAQSHAKPESNLRSIASASLHVSRSHPPSMTSPASAPADRPAEQDKEAESNSSRVAREALGASEKSPGPSLHEPSVHASPEQIQVDSHHNDTSSDPYGSTDHNQNSLIHSSTVASPGPIEDTASQDGDRPRPRADSEVDQDSNKAFSYPCPPVASMIRVAASAYPTRVITGAAHDLRPRKNTAAPIARPNLPGNTTLRAISSLTVKRSLFSIPANDPIFAPSGRRFARGDALARHNKGQGGCAGRRASMGSFAADDEYGDGHHPDDAMDGLVYAEPEHMDEEDERRLMPSIRKHEADHLPRSDSLQSHRQPSTYPPIAAGRSLFPPPGTHGGSGSSTTTTSQPGNLTFPPAGHPSSSSMFTPTNVNDSPKPLSPNALSHHDNVQPHRAHSPSIGQSLPHPPPFVRTGSGSSHAPPGLGLPPPQPGAPQLPPPVISSPDARFGLQAAAKHSASHSHSSTHSLPAPKLGPDGPEIPAGEASQIDKLWAYVRSMHDEMVGLRTEVAALRAHIASTNSTTAPAPVEVNQISGPR